MIQKKCLFITTNHRRYRNLPTSKIGLKFERMWHMNCGGPTSYQIIFDHCNLLDYSPAENNLRRRIGDFINYAIKSTLFQEGTVIRYTVYNLVIANHMITRPVVETSTYFGTGWGVRALGVKGTRYHFWIVTMDQTDQFLDRRFHLPFGSNLGCITDPSFSESSG